MTHPLSELLADPPLRRRHRVHVTRWSPAPPAAVFALLADVTTWTSWAGFAEAFYEHEGWERHGAGAIRRFRIGPLSSRETVLALEHGRRLTYAYDGSLPFEQYRGDVTLSRQRGGTRIEWRADFTVRNSLTGPLLRWFMTRVLTSITARLAEAASSRPGH